MAAEREILIVDDDADVRRALTEALADEGTSVRAAENAERALALLGEDTADVVLSDVRMPGLSGLQLLELLRERCPDTDVVLITAYDDMDTVVRATRNGAVDFLVKPLDLHELRAAITRIFTDRAARERVRGTAATADAGLVGRDPAMIAIYKQIGHAASSSASVLIRGESGTGKELVARAIHDHSAAAAEPFVAVNCAALPTALLESELFGHVRGAFTGAISSRRGRFALAGRGTIFLDEIGDTTPDLQTRLLRVLQERQYEPVGAEHMERVEARVIAATHRDLPRMVERAQFREDLYYRLRVIEICIPPLRERAGDIPLLAGHLVRRLAERFTVPAPVLSGDALDALRLHTWPGNVRELENCLARAVVYARGGVIHAQHLHLEDTGSRDAQDLATLDRMEAEHIERVLAAAGGNKTRAAHVLGISRPRLNRLLRKHALD